MSGMFLANHSSIGLPRSASGLSRNLVIQSGSLFGGDVRTTSRCTLGGRDVVLGAVGPAELVLAEINAGTAIGNSLVGAPRRGAEVFHYAHSNNPRAVIQPDARLLVAAWACHGPDLLDRCGTGSPGLSGVGVVNLRRLVQEILRHRPGTVGAVVAGAWWWPTGWSSWWRRGDSGT
jgi:hypothetical protein